MEILILDYRITEDAKVFKGEKEMSGHQDVNGYNVYGILGYPEPLQKTIARKLFDVSESLISRLFVRHINFNRGDNSFHNIKIFSKLDYKNKSGRYVALHNGEPYYFENNKPIRKSENIRLELNIF